MIDQAYQQWHQQQIALQQQRYQQQIEALRGLMYQQGPVSPANYGFGAMGNPLLQRADVPQLAQANAQAGNPMLMQYLMGLSGPAAGATLDPDQQLMQSLMSGVGGGYGGPG